MKFGVSPWKYSQVDKNRPPSQDIHQQKLFPQRNSRYTAILMQNFTFIGILGCFHGHP